jgi:O-antigen ligase
LKVLSERLLNNGAPEERLKGFSKAAMYLLTLWVLLPPLIPPLQADWIKISVVDPLGAVSLILIVAAALCGKIRYSTFHASVIVFCIICIVTTASFWGEHEFVESLLRAIRQAFVFSPIFLVALIPLQIRLYNTLLACLIVSYGLGILLSMIFYSAGFDFATAHQQFWSPEGVHVAPRAGGTVGDSSAFGHLIASWAAIAIGVLSYQPARPRKLILIALVVGVAGWGLYGALARSAILDLVVALALLLVLHPAGLRRLTAFRLVLIVTVPLTVAVLSSFSLIAPLPQDFHDRVNRFIAPFEAILGFGDAPTTNLDSLSSGRLSNWATIWKVLSDNWLFGAGYKYLSLKFNLPADNMFILTFAEIGLFGSIAFVLVLAVPLIRLLSRSRRDTMLSRIGLAMWVGQVCHAIFVDTFTFYTSMPMVLIFIALAMRPLQYAANTAAARYVRKVHSFQHSINVSGGASGRTARKL